MNYRVVLDENYLAHHGIPHQKWGVKNGPPYPLDRQTHAKVTKQKVYSGKSKSEEPNTPKNPNDHSKSDKSQLALFIAKVGIDALNINPVGIVNDFARLSRVGYEYCKNSHYMKERVSEIEDKSTGLKKKSKDLTKEQDMARINPIVHNFDLNTKRNCMLCTTAYEMRRRGFDVQANKASRGYYPENLKDWYKNPKIKEVSFMTEKKKVSTKEMTDQLRKELLSQGDGSRGNLMVRWKGLNKGGHSMVYEIENNDVVIRDCQVNKIYKLSKIMSMSSPEDMHYCRTDNLEINKKRIKEAVS